METKTKPAQEHKMIENTPIGILTNELGEKELTFTNFKLTDLKFKTDEECLEHMEKNKWDIILSMIIAIIHITDQQHNHEELEELMQKKS